MAILVLLFSHAYSWRQLSAHRRIQAIHDSRDRNRLLHDIFICVRCPSVLANPRDVLLRLVCVDHEKAITVSWFF